MPPKINSREIYSFSSFQDSRVLDFHHPPPNSVWHPPFWKCRMPHCWGLQHKEANESQKVGTQRQGSVSLWNINTLGTGTILRILLRDSSLGKASYYNNLLTRFNPHWHQKRPVPQLSPQRLALLRLSAAKAFVGPSKTIFKHEDTKSWCPFNSLLSDS